MTLAMLLVLSLATFRITRLIVIDDVTRGLRLRVLRRFPPYVVPMRDAVGRDVEGTSMMQPRWPVVLTSCSWCLGVWVALVAVLAAHGAGMVHGWAPTVFAWPAVAGLSGVTSEVAAWLTK